VTKQNVRATGCPYQRVDIRAFCSIHGATTACETRFYRLSLHTQQDNLQGSKVGAR